MSYIDNATKSIDGGIKAEGVSEGRCLRVSHASDMEDSPYCSREISLTVAQLTALRATPVTLVPAPGANKVIVLRDITLIASSAASPLTSVQNALVKYTDGSGQAASGTITGVGLFDTATINVSVALGIALTGTAVINAPLVLHNTGAGEMSGTSPDTVCKVKVTYEIHATV